jgi:small subunit ribosomal protein S8
MDPLTDMLNRIRNAQAVLHPLASVPFSNLKYEIAKILEKQGFIEKY